MALVKRTVIGPNADRKSAILYRDSPNEQDIPNVARRSTLWAATELPIDNSIKGDRGADVTIREPTENGMIFRVLEIPPDMKDKKKHIEMMGELNRKVKQKYPPTEKTWSGTRRCTAPTRWTALWWCAARSTWSRTRTRSCFGRATRPWCKALIMPGAIAPMNRH